MYVTHEEPWLDLSLRNLAGDWLRCVEERFADVNISGPKASKLQSYSSLDKPSTFVTSFFEKYPLATVQLLAHEDKSYFLNIAQRSAQKPAPFIPILDNNFEVWFKKVQSLRMVFGCSSTHSFIIAFSLGVGRYQNSLRPGPPARGDPSGPRSSASFD